MKTEDKELLLRDLSGRLPYGVKCKIHTHVHGDTVYKLTDIRDNGYTCGTVKDKYAWAVLDISEVKPYLFPLSSMSMEQLNDFYATIRPVIEESLEEYGNDKTDYEGERPITMKTIKCDIVAVNWMLKNHFDINGLIPMDLAIDATGLNIYKEG